jgi:hypothetical protein
MKNILTLVGLALVAASIGTHASDRVGIYAVVDRVVFEPTADAPERVQVWGAFAVAKQTERDFYEPVQRGYLYFTPADDKKLTRAEWNDLKSLAGTKRIAAFSARFGQSVRVRPPDEKPQAPDRYTLGVGVQTIQQNRDYAPIRELSAYLER